MEKKADETKQNMAIAELPALSYTAFSSLNYRHRSQNQAINR